MTSVKSRRFRFPITCIASLLSLGWLLLFVFCGSNLLRFEYLTIRHISSNAVDDVIGAVALVAVGLYVDHLLDSQKDKQERERNEERLAFVAHERFLLKEVVYSVTEGKLRLCDSAEELPPACNNLSSVIDISDTSILSEVRRQVRRAARAGGFPKERWYDLMGGASEAAMNALQHGRDTATIQIAVCNPTTSTIQIWIRDRGQGIRWEDLPRATLMLGHSNSGTLGHGFWLMLNGCDRLWLLTGPSGTTVVMEQDRIPPAPAWIATQAQKSQHSSPHGQNEHGCPDQGGVVRAEQSNSSFIPQ